MRTVKFNTVAILYPIILYAIMELKCNEWKLNSCLTVQLISFESFLFHNLQEEVHFLANADKCAFLLLLF